MNRIDKKFIDLKEQHKKALIAFITAGYPSLNITMKLIVEFERIGVDIVELGVPFTDPMADGPVIQESSQQALKKGVHLKDILDLVKKVREKVNLPICLMTYYNPIFCFGESAFVAQAKEAGVDGVIIPDLPPEESGELIKAANKAGINIIFFLSPTSTLKRIKLISKCAKGFIYYVSLTGVTGSRRELPKDLSNNLKLIKSHTKKPVCVGFGISSREQVRQIHRIADGAIIGSAIVKKIKESTGRRDLVKRVSGFVESLMHERTV